MSTGRSITCDRCNQIMRMTEEEWRTMDVPSGWIRVNTVEPRRWNWTSEPVAEGFIQDGDFCSVSCLTSWAYAIEFPNE